MKNPVSATIILRVTEGPDAGTFFRSKLSEVHIGRSSENDLVLARDSAASQRHARVVRRSEGWFVEDHGSRNGTYLVNKGRRTRIAKDTLMELPQCIEVGESLVELKETLSDIDDELSGCGSSSHKMAQVRIDLEGDELKFQLLTSGAHGTRYTTPFHESDLDHVNQRLEALTREHAEGRGVGAGATVREVLAEVGRYLRDHVVPVRVQEKLADSDASDMILIHHKALVHVPWELVYIDETPLCLAFNLGRQILMDDHSVALQREKEETHPKVLIIANPTGDLTDAQEMGEAVFDLTHRHEDRVDVDFVAGPRVRRMDLLSRMEQSDIVFYIGHAEFDEHSPKNSGWLLSEDRLACADIRRLNRPPSLVIAMGCETGKEQSWTSQEASEHGLAGAFVLAGVENYVGALWPIRADKGVLFGRTLFENILAGVSIGSALRLARQHLLVRDRVNDFTWASFVLYGDPSRKCF